MHVSYCRDFVSVLAWEHLSLPPEEMEEGGGHLLRRV